MSFERFTTYKEAIHNDLKLDQFNINNKVYEIPSLKHYWVGKLIELKIELKELNRKKNELIKKANNAEEIGLQLSVGSAKRALAKSPVIAKINEEIEDLELIIEYLEKVEKMFSSMTYDIKNAIELIKMEQM